MTLAHIGTTDSLAAKLVTVLTDGQRGSLEQPFGCLVNILMFPVLFRRQLTFFVEN